MKRVAEVGHKVASWLGKGWLIHPIAGSPNRLTKREYRRSERKESKTGETGKRSKNGLLS